MKLGEIGLLKSPNSNRSSGYIRVLNTIDKGVHCLGDFSTLLCSFALVVEAGGVEIVSLDQQENWDDQFDREQKSLVGAEQEPVEAGEPD